MIGQAHNLSPYLKDLIGDMERRGELDRLAREVLDLARSSLLVNLRFMDGALIQVAPASSTATKDLATDGQFLYFYPLHVLRSYKQARETVARDYLHAVLHCVFRHPFVGPGVHTPVWDLA